jgi:DDE superfamily endonuclease
MFDNTNIIIQHPNNADAQRSTYSLYYAGNVGKGAVFIQPCGWMGSHEVWTGGVSDSMYMQQADVFDTLNKFILTYDNDVEERFTIILDKGYRIVFDAFNNGGHFTLQPIFAEYENQFTTLESAINTTVATDRSGNERAVWYLKISDYVSKGLITNESVDTLCNTWLAWGFQVNFMYKPVH